MDFYDSLEEVTEDQLLTYTEQLDQQSLENGLTFEDYSFVPKEPVLSPSTLMAAMERGTCDYAEEAFVLILRPKDASYTRFVPLETTPRQDFLGGHPFAKIQKGEEVEINTSDQTVERRFVKEISPQKGEIEFDKAVVTITIYLNIFGGSIERQKIYQSINDLYENWGKPNNYAKQVIEKQNQGGGSLNFETNLGYARGYVAAGKTFSLAQDAKMFHQDREKPVIVIANTNAALAQVRVKLNGMRVPSIQYTNKEIPFGYKALLKDREEFVEWNAWRRKNPENGMQRLKKSEVRTKFRTLLFRFVVMVTPSKFIDLRKSLKTDEVTPIVLVDEAGLMPIVSMCGVLAAQVSKIWIYGDHKQLTPWDDKRSPAAPENDVFDYAIRTTSQLMVISIAQWFTDMNVPMRTMSEIKRLPKVDIPHVKSFFYERNHVSKDMEWQKTKEIVTKWRIRSTAYVPESLIAYPYMSRKAKQKESCRLASVLTYLVREVGEKLKEDQFKEPEKEEINVVSPYSYVQPAFLEIKKRHYAALDQYYSFEVHTTRVAQGSEWKRTIFIPPSTPGSFVTDSHFLVGMTRHTEKLEMLPFKATNLINQQMAWVLIVLGIAKVKLKSVLSENVVYRRKHGLDSMEMGLVSINLEKAKDFFFSRSFENYKKMVNFHNLSEEQRILWRRNAGISDEILKIFLERPKTYIHFEGEGNYSYLLFGMKEIYWRVKCVVSDELELENARHMYFHPTGIMYSGKKLIDKSQCVKIEVESSNYKTKIKKKKSGMGIGEVVLPKRRKAVGRIRVVSSVRKNKKK